MIKLMGDATAKSGRAASAKRVSLLLLPSGEKSELLATAERFVPVIEPVADVRVTDLSQGEDLSRLDFDLAVVVGGDGSMLRAAHQMGRRQRPVVGVNLGKLGFLADLSPDDFVKQLPSIVAGEYQVIEHLMYECRVLRAGRVLHERLGLNEVAILGGPPFAILDVDLYVDAELVTTYSCDGLIISTPVGSTAHNLSSGGPILRKDLQAFVVSPISPHTLTNRPVVDTAERVYELAVPDPHEGTALVTDGRMVCKLEGADRVRVERSAAKFQMVALRGQSYYRTLREKLGWGGRLQLKS